MPSIKFYNTLSREKAAFVPLDVGNVRIYACGPTVYDRIHVGNARPVVLFDVLVRLLRPSFFKGNLGVGYQLRQRELQR